MPERDSQSYQGLLFDEAEQTQIPPQQEEGGGEIINPKRNRGQRFFSGYGFEEQSDDDETKPIRVGWFD